MEFQVDSTLEWVAPLAEVIHLARSKTAHGKGVILRVGEVSAPEVDRNSSEISRRVRARQGVKGLAVGVGLVPIGLPLCVDVGANNDCFEHAVAGDTVIGRGRECMCRDERHLLVLVVNRFHVAVGAHAVDIFLEYGMRKAVVDHP